jgi:putative FmdB family regulatory protein|tara:strand:+ start:250 stop:576 length:327 start_codon:yes stop_codon:yes gene_type:complete
VPIYEYACKSCDHTLDALQKMSDDPLVDCPECGEAALKRLISAPRFRLKGQGWYETDFKKDNQRNLAKGDSEAAPSAKSDDKKEPKTIKEESKKADTKKEATSKSDVS